jgi:uncharacterized protein YbbC (DUF1343 family)
MRLVGNDAVLAKLKAGEGGRQILDSVRGDLEQFRRIRAKYLLYE